MPFGVPMVWREPTNHLNDCYFCMTKISGFSTKNKQNIEYPNLPSALRPVPHSEDVPIPTVPVELNLSLSSSDSSQSAIVNDDDYTTTDNKAPKLMSQSDLDDLVRDLDLPKQSAQLLGS